MSAIITRELLRRYGNRVGIEDVELNVGEGEIFGFLGPNGAGKTTTIRILMGMMRADSGTAQILGRDCWKQSHLVKRDVGYLPGDLHLYPWLTADRGLAILRRVRGASAVDFGNTLLDRLRLDRKVLVKRMSRGMRQKLGIVLALAHQPRVLILDEPTAGLDPLMQAELADCLREFASQGHTVFFSSHTLSEVEQLCERVAVVRSGRIVESGAIEDLTRRAGRVVTLRYRDAETAQNVRLPPILESIERTGAVWRGELAGGTTELVRWAALQPLEDITIAAPSLESLFRRFYQQEVSPQ